MVIYQSELMTLQGALELTKHALTPGALSSDGKRLVQYDDESTLFLYCPDVSSQPLQIQRLAESQLARVDRARAKSWIPAGNFVV